MRRFVTIAIAGALIFAACGADSEEGGADVSVPQEDSITDDAVDLPSSEEPSGEGDSAEEPDTEAQTVEPTEEITVDETPGPDAQYGGELRIAIPAAPGPLHPVVLFASFAETIAINIYDTLLTIDEQGSLQPLLATDYSSPDGGNTWVLDLREGVAFSDGTPFDAEAVVAHFEVLMDPASECPCIANFAAMDSVTASGPLQVTFSLSAPSASFPSLLAGNIGMVSAPAGTPDNPIGAGPFMIDEVREGESYRLVANSNYWQEGLPYLDSVVYRVIPDLETQLASVKSGELDVTTPMPNSRVPQIEADDSLVRVPFGGFGNLMLNFQTEQPPFDDVRARRAVAKALDLAVFHESFNNGAVEPATSIYNRNSWAYPGEVATYPSFDLEGAKALVEELGGLKVNLLVPAFYADQIVPIQAMMVEAGIEVELDQRDNVAAITAYRQGDYQVVFTGYSGALDPQDSTMMYQTGSFLNVTKYSDPEMDELIAQADLVLDESARAEIYAQIAEIAARDVPVAVINNYNDYYVASPEVNGQSLAPDGLVRITSTWLEQ